MGLLVNRAKANTTTSGTGAVTPGSAVSPYQTWSAAGAVSGLSYDYLIEFGTAWEIGTGVYNGTTVTRPGPGVDPNFASSTGSLLSLSGTGATVACVASKNTVTFPWYWNPPLASAFPTIGHSSNESSNFTLTDDPYVGLIVDNPLYSGTGDRMRYALQAVPAGTSWTATMRATASIDTQTAYSAVGMVIRESGTNKNVLFFNVKKDGAGTYTGADCWTNSGSTFNSNVATVLMSPVPAPWIQFQRSGSTLNYNISYDGRRFFQLTSTALTAFFTTAPDLIGLGMGSNNSTSATGTRQSLTVDAWSAG